MHSHRSVGNCRGVGRCKQNSKGEVRAESWGDAEEKEQEMGESGGGCKGGRATSSPSDDLSVSHRLAQSGGGGSGDGCGGEEEGRRRAAKPPAGGRVRPERSRGADVGGLQDIWKRVRALWKRERFRRPKNADKV